MDLTQQSVLSFLIQEGGKVKKSELVKRFKGAIDCDTEEKERNRDLFKNLVNNVAVVKEIDGVRFVVVRKKYEPLVESFQAQEKTKDSSEDVNVVRKGEPQRLPEQSEEESNDNELQEEGDCESAKTESPIQMALQRCKSDFKMKRGMTFNIQSEEKRQHSAQSKPYALPLRIPPIDIHKIKADDLNGPGCVKGVKSADASATVGSPGWKKSPKSSKVSAELKENRGPSVVPLEQTEHEWLVKCASGHWSQVHGMLLRDSQLAEKKDFISGFTALHWAVKFGNSEMLVRLFELSKRGGVELDVNAKTHGGYTPLHIAALHDQEYILAMLVAEYGADVKIRDNCGRRAYHYLHKGVSQTIREMMGEPKATNKELKVVPCEKEEQDVFPEHSKGLYSLSKLFQPHSTGHKRKAKRRPSLLSLQDEPEMEGREEQARYRLMSDVLM
ncbi:unnamed protein product [Knipowitschia caucasica]|uniref:SOWAHA-C winged helix-turn-helix domain-containing protein n=1 Tax=Knipowitschia caucasica TaxID=637954 RepID=A0AAV2JB63_KNICA